MHYQYLTKDEIIKINKDIMDRYSETFGYRNESSIDNIICLPCQINFGQEVYDSISKKAGILFIKIIKKHPFRDGNKRTAVICLDIFIEENDFILIATDDDLAQKALDIAKCDDSDLNYDDIYRWLDSVII